MNFVEKQLAAILRRNWWVLLLRGLAAIAFGVLVWMQPGISLNTLVLLFGAYSLADGILGAWTAVVKRREQQHWVLLLLGGLLGIGIGIMTFVVPGVTALALVYYIAIWAIATGVLQIAAAIRLRKEIDNERLLIVCGFASVLFGVLLMARPEMGVLSLLWLIATYGIVFGVLLVILAFKARSFMSDATPA